MVVFREILPNPLGKDTDGEWIKIANIGDQPVNLSGWTIRDKSGKTFLFSQISEEYNVLPGGKDLILKYSLTKISLNNDGDELSIYNQEGQLIDKISYTGPVSDDEIIYGEEFLPQTNTSAQAESLELNEAKYTEQGLLEGSKILAPLLAGIIIAVVFGILIGFITHKFYKKNE
jgi:hypothetical protein